MRHNHLKIRIWLALAVAIASLGFTSSALAMLPAADGTASGATPLVPTVTSTGSSFNWADAAVGAGVALGVTLSGIGIAYLARNRTRLAT
jgi:hypothetical protein